MVREREKKDFLIFLRRVSVFLTLATDSLGQFVERSPFYYPFIYVGLPTFRKNVDL